MNINEFINELTQWFDFSIHMVRNHPVVSVATAMVAFLFYQALSTLKLIGTIISFGLAVVMAIVLKVLMP